MKEFLNEDKKPFSKLTPEEMHCVVMNFIDNNIEFLHVSGGDKWLPKRTHKIFIYAIYRTKHAKKLVIPWDSLKPEYVCAAMDKNGDIYVYEHSPMKEGEFWKLIKGRTDRIMALAGVESDGVDWETSLTFRDEAK